MRFGGLHISDLFVTNPELSKLQLLCLGDEERDTGYGIWLPDICPVHLIFVVRRWRRPSQNLKFSENRADQSLEFFDLFLAVSFASLTLLVTLDALSEHGGQPTVPLELPASKREIEVHVPATRKDQSTPHTRVG